MDNSQKKAMGRPAVWVWLAGFLLLLAFAAAYIFYNKIYGPNVIAHSGEGQYLYVRTNSNFDDLVKNLESHHILKSTKDFIWTAKLKKFGKVIKPGKYKLRDGMSNQQLIGKLRLGEQEPVDVILHGLRLEENLAGFVSHRLEADSLGILTLLKDPKYTDSLGYTPNNVYTLFIPNTYRFKWNTSAREFLERMNRESNKFWTASRLHKASMVGLDKKQVMILASIVNQESNKADEMPVIASVYLNRLHKGIKLDADPTVIYANQDFTIKRVTQKYLVKDSPYNTYMYAGLPPGPITMPVLSAVEAVLNPRETDYLFFCVRDDFSGYHAFAVTREEHMVNARRFHKALDERNIH